MLALHVRTNTLALRLFKDINIRTVINFPDTLKVLYGIIVGIIY